MHLLLPSSSSPSSQDLQRLQEANREKLTAITQSVEKAEVQAALERNPDISKERSNLLQGIGTTRLCIQTVIIEGLRTRVV